MARTGPSLAPTMAQYLGKKHGRTTLTSPLPRAAPLGLMPNHHLRRMTHNHRNTRAAHHRPRRNPPHGQLPKTRAQPGTRPQRSPRAKNGNNPRAANAENRRSRLGDTKENPRQRRSSYHRSQHPDRAIPTRQRTQVKNGPRNLQLPRWGNQLAPQQNTNASR